MSKIISIRELAALAGCGKTVVSLALRNHPKVPAHKRAMIQKLAEKHGYKRDPVISTLMNQLRSRRQRTTEKLGILSWSFAGKNRNPLGKDLFSNQLIEGIQKRATALGYDVDFFNAWERDMTGARLSRILYTRGIRGIILLSKPHARGHVSLNWSYFAAATTSYTILKPNLPRAMSSLFQGMMLALRHLRRLGYKRVGFVNLVKTEDMINEAWLAAHLAYHFRMHGKIDVPPLLLQEWNPKKISAWLEKYKVQAVVSNWRNVLDLLKGLGYRVPQDMGFASLDCLPSLNDCAGIHQRRDLVAALAVDLVVEQLESNKLGLPEDPKTVLVDCIWRDGPTLLRRKS